MAQRLVTAAASRAACTLDPEDIFRRIRAGRCERTGIPFDLGGNDGTQRVRPWFPSLDRIDSGKPYTPDNVEVVVAAFNLAKNEWPIEVFRRLAHGFISLDAST